MDKKRVMGVALIAAVVIAIITLNATNITGEAIFESNALNEDLISYYRFDEGVNDAKRVNDGTVYGDVEQIAIQAHKIKGSSANMGGMVLSELAKTIEYAGKDSDTETIHQQLPKLQQSFDMLKEEIEKVLF